MVATLDFRELDPSLGHADTTETTKPGAQEGPAA